MHRGSALSAGFVDVRAFFHQEFDQRQLLAQDGEGQRRVAIVRLGLQIGAGREQRFGSGIHLPIFGGDDQRSRAAGLALAGTATASFSVRAISHRAATPRLTSDVDDRAIPHLGSQMHERKAFIIHGIGIGAAFEKCCHIVLLAVIDREQKRTVPVLALVLDIRAGLQQRVWTISTLPDSATAKSSVVVPESASRL